MTWLVWLLTDQRGRFRWFWLPFVAVLYVAGQLVFALPLMLIVLPSDRAALRRWWRIQREALPLIANGETDDWAAFTRKVWSGGFVDPRG